jgi:hypothetical protein
MSIDGENQPEQNLAKECMKQIEEDLVKEDGELKELDEEILKAELKGKKVIRDPEP